MTSREHTGGLTTAFLAGCLAMMGCSELAVVPAAGAGGMANGGAAAAAGAGGTGAAGGAGAEGGTASVGGGGGVPATVLHPGVLTDDGLLVRYYIDEAAQGVAPTELVDAASNPLPLSLSYAGSMAFSEESPGHRGLKFTEAEKSDMASASVAGTKVASQLSGAAGATVELVLKVEQVTWMASRFLHLGSGSDRSLAIASASATIATLSVDVGFLTEIQSPVGWVGNGRVVLHGVFDSAQPFDHDRMRMYVNGSRLTSHEQSAGGTSDLLNLNVGDTLVLGNRPLGERTFQGTLYYAAIYRTALSDEQLRQNVLVLLDSDDTPSK